MIRRILVVLPNWFGETLFATPFLHALKAGLPDAKILTLGWPQCRLMLLHNPDVAECIDYDDSAGLGALPSAIGLIGRLRAERFDAAIILRKSLSRSLILTLSGIARRIGFAHPKSRWLLTDRVAGAPVGVHKAASYLPLLEPLGIKPLLEPCRYTVSADERKAMSRWLIQEGIRPGERLVILHPGANWPHKRWASERFAQLGDRLIQAHGVRVAITGTADDAPLAEAIRSAMLHPQLCWAGQMSLRQVGACLEQAALLVSNDTGVLHLAAAVACPLVGLYGPTSPALTGPLGIAEKIRVVQGKDACPHVPCYSPDKPPHPGMDSVSVSDAAEAAAQLLKARG